MVKTVLESETGRKRVGQACRLVYEGLKGLAWMSLAGVLLVGVGLPYAQRSFRATCHELAGAEVDGFLHAHGIIHQPDPDGDVLERFAREKEGRNVVYVRSWLVCDTSGLQPQGEGGR